MEVKLYTIDYSNKVSESGWKEANSYIISVIDNLIGTNPNVVCIAGAKDDKKCWLIIKASKELCCNE